MNWAEKIAPGHSDGISKQIFCGGLAPLYQFGGCIVSVIEEKET